MSDQLSTALRLANESLTLAIGNFGTTLRHYAEAAAITVNRVGTMLGSIMEAYRDEQRIKAVATPRQWYLYQNGSPKVSKKWRNALLRKARIAEKRNGGHRP